MHSLAVKCGLLNCNCRSLQRDFEPLLDLATEVRVKAGKDI